MSKFFSLKANDIVYSAKEMERNFFSQCKFVNDVTSGDGRLIVGGFMTHTAFVVSEINKSTPPLWLKLKTADCEGATIKLTAVEFAQYFTDY